MDWIRLFALVTVLVTVASYITAEGTKKKIRIHLPQKVKHIHHHKKIYITNHPTSPQYAPAFMPSAEGAIAVPTNVALPAVASIVPLSSVELYGESKTRLPRMPVAGSKLLPLYRNRGYYGPTNTEWEDQEYDLVPPPEPTDHAYAPTAFGVPSEKHALPTRQPNRVKMPKIHEAKYKSTTRKPKPQRIVVRGRPQIEDEHPVSTFHEMFYSDLDGTGTIKKIKKPQRIEKIVDGDTEHIHTYSEEHIHKLVYDDAKLPDTVGPDQMSSMSAIAASHQYVPFKSPQALIAFPSDTLPGFSSIGSLGTPTHLEYAAYAPREVTHDHIFHDHGEIPPHIDIIKDPLSIPPKITYNSQGLPIVGIPKELKNKYTQKYNKAVKEIPSTDLTYYENIFTPHIRPKIISKPTIQPSFFDTSDIGLETYNHASPFKQKNEGNNKNRNTGTSLYFNNAKQNAENPFPQANIPSPFSISSSGVQKYKSKTYAGNKLRDSLANFKDSSYSNNFEYDALASPVNIFTSEDKKFKSRARKNKKKTISTQNISFGGQNQQSAVDHLEDFGISAVSTNEDSLGYLEDFNNYEQAKMSESITSTPFTIKETSPIHSYYSAMAMKSFHGDQVVAEASNKNMQYMQMNNPSTTLHPPSEATIITPSSNYLDETFSNSEPEPTEYVLKVKKFHRPRNADSDDNIGFRKQKYLNNDLKFHKEPNNENLFGISGYPEDEQVTQSTTMSNLKYGDKI